MRCRRVVVFVAVTAASLTGVDATAQALPVGHTVKRIEVPGAVGSDRRKVDVHLWYPAQGATGSKTVYQSALRGQPLDPQRWDPLAWSLQAKLAYEDVPVAAGATPFPVVVFSHGSVNDPMNEATMLELIASAGFVVAAPSHVTDTQEDVRIDYINQQAGTRLFQCNDGVTRSGPLVANECSRPGAANETGQATLNQRMLERSRDISAVLDQLPGWLGGRADMAKIGVLGHSRGTLSGLGAAAGSATWGVAREPRVQAVMGMASGGTAAATLQPNLAAVRIPVLWVAGGRDQNSPSTVNTAGFNALGGADKELLVLPDAHHRTFLSTFCDQLQASGAIVKGPNGAPNPRAILDAHTFNAIRTNANSGNAVDYCPLSAFTTPVDIRPLITGFDFATRSVPTTGLSQDVVTQQLADRAAEFFTTELAHVQGAPVGGTVPATLALTLGPAPSFGAFTPGVERTYTASGTATVTSSAGDAALTVSDPSPTASGRLVNGPYALVSPLLAGGNPLPAVVRTWSGPVANEASTIAFAQRIGATEPLRTGTYSKTLTFTLSTASP
jgi:predicted dienelactone hydrolase